MHEVADIGDALFVGCKNGVLDEGKVLKGHGTLYLYSYGGCVSDLGCQKTEQKLDKAWILDGSRP